MWMGLGLVNSACRSSPKAFPKRVVVVMTWAGRAMSLEERPADTPAVSLPSSRSALPGVAFVRSLTLFGGVLWSLSVAVSIGLVLDGMGGKVSRCGNMRLERRDMIQAGYVFNGFVTEDLDVGDAVIHVRHGGQGPAVLLLHGHPRTGATWHKVAPLLVAAGFNVVCPDLRGYGASNGPEPTSDHSAHSKRAVANDMAKVMTMLGHDRFHLVGHDRGSYVAFRLALDHGQRVERLTLIDCVPISEHLARADARFATRWWHWFFFAQPDIPERVINADPDAWYGADPEVMGIENYAEWREAIHNPRVVRAMLEDYRAGLTIDRADESADKAAGRQLDMPVLALWSLQDDLEDLYGDPLTIWRDWATDVRGHGIDSRHHVAEEAPHELATAIIRFIDTSLTD